MRRWAPIAVAVALALGGLAGGLVAVIGSDDDPATASDDVLASGRDHVEVCIEAHPSITDDAAAPIAEALKRARQSPTWAADLYGPGDPRVVEGCPGGYIGLSAPISPKGDDFPHGRIVDAASPYRAFFFVLSVEEAMNLRGDPFARAPLESMCEGHNCREVTTAAFLDPAALSNPAELDAAVEVGLGLRALDGGYPEGRPPTEPGEK